MSTRWRLGSITFGAVKSAVRRVLTTFAWLALMVVIGLGGAGIVNAMDHQPGTAARAELTSVGDGQVVPLLDAATTDLSALADQVAALGVQARGALAALNGTSTSTADAAIAAGNRLVSDLRARTSPSGASWRPFRTSAPGACRSRCQRTSRHATRRSSPRSTPPRASTTIGSG